MRPRSRDLPFPKTAWHYWAATVRLEERYTALTHEEQTRMLSAEWRALGDLEKVPFQQMAAAAMVEYESKLTAAEALMAVEAEEAGSGGAVSAGGLVAGSIAQGVKDSKPKRPTNAYILWYKAACELEPFASMHHMERTKAIGASWKTLSADQKEPYFAQQMASSAKYQLELTIYNKANAENTDAEDEDEDEDTEQTHSSVTSTAPDAQPSWWQRVSANISAFFPKGAGNVEGNASAASAAAGESAAGASGEGGAQQPKGSRPAGSAKRASTLKRPKAAMPSRTSARQAARGARKRYHEDDDDEDD